MTPELKAAHEKLEAAINEVLRLRGFQIGAGGIDMVLTDWVVAAVQQSIQLDDDGHGMTSFVRLIRPGQPLHSTLGVLRGVCLELDRDFVNNEDE